MTTTPKPQPDSRSIGIGLLITLILLGIALVASLSGCMSVQKATNYLDKKGELPIICAERYPTQALPPDTSDRQRPSVPDSLIDALEQKLLSVTRQLAYVQGLPPVIDSARCQQLRQQLEQQAQQLQNDIIVYKRQLARLTSTDRTITNTLIDSAALAALRVRYNRLQSEHTELQQLHAKDTASRNKAAAKQQAELNDWKEKAQARGRRLRNIYIVGGLLVLGIGIGLFLRLKKKIA